VAYWSVAIKEQLKASFPIKYMHGISLNKADCQSVLPQFPIARDWEEIQFKFINILRSRDDNMNKEAVKAAVKVVVKAIGMQSVSSAGIMGNDDNSE
jgi:hypothetical protein